MITHKKTTIFQELYILQSHYTLGNFNCWSNPNPKTGRQRANNLLNFNFSPQIWRSDTLQLTSSYLTSKAIFVLKNKPKKRPPGNIPIKPSSPPYCKIQWWVSNRLWNFSAPHESAPLKVTDKLSTPNWEDQEHYQSAMVSVLSIHLKGKPQHCFYGFPLLLCCGGMSRISTDSLRKIAVYCEA